MPKRRRSRLTTILARLRRTVDRIKPPPVRDPYRLILWEQVAYQSDDTTRLAAFRLLESEVGTAPESIIAAPFAALKRVTRAGGSIGVALRATRIRFVARRVVDRWDGDLWPVIKLPYDDAIMELMRYPSIGRPVAERILLLAGAHRPLALDSNGVRVLLRLGYGRDRGRYDKTYGSVQAAAAPELADTQAARVIAHFVLRAHGQSVCTRTAPACNRCSVLADCPVGLNS